MNEVSPKSRNKAMLMCFPLSICRLYVGKKVTGLLWLFTGGLFGIGMIIDLIMLMSGKFKDKDGLPLISKGKGKIIGNIYVIIPIALLFMMYYGNAYTLITALQIRNNPSWSAKAESYERNPSENARIGLVNALKNDALDLESLMERTAEDIAIYRKYVDSDLTALLETYWAQFTEKTGDEFLIGMKNAVRFMSDNNLPFDNLQYPGRVSHENLHIVPLENHRDYQKITRATPGSSYLIVSYSDDGIKIEISTMFQFLTIDRFPVSLAEADGIIAIRTFRDAEYHTYTSEVKGYNTTTDINIYDPSSGTIIGNIASIYSETPIFIQRPTGAAYDEIARYPIEKVETALLNFFR